MDRQPGAELLALTKADRQLDAQPAGTVADTMADAAGVWLSTLTDGQRAVAIHPEPGPAADEERTRWFYVPTDHGGLPLGRQSPRQQRAALRLVATGLSHAGFNAVSTIMGLENVLDRLEDFTVDWGRERGRDPGLFYLSLFGRAGDDVWGWRFGGHHLSLNNLIVDGRLMSVTPQFFGADPARSPLPGNAELRPLGPVHDLGLALVRSLDGQQRKAAILLDRAIPDLVGGNRVRIADGDQMMRVPDLFRLPITDPAVTELAEALDQKMNRVAGLGPEDHALLALTDAPKGLAAQQMTAHQQELLRQLLGSYFERAPEFLGERHRGRYADSSELERLHFAWAGGLGDDEPQYYRIQGPELLIEYDNTQRLGNHVHSVWRDPTTDFGLDALAAHHRGFHQPHA